MNTFAPLPLMRRTAALSVLRRRVFVVSSTRFLSSASSTNTTKNDTSPSSSLTKPIPFAVEAPDGSSEALMDAERHEVDEIIDHAAQFENRTYVQNLHDQQEVATRTFAVDAPDGEADDIHEEDVHAVEDIIDYAAEHEDKEEVLFSHKAEEEVVKVRAGRRVPDYSQVPKF